MRYPILEKGSPITKLSTFIRFYVSVSIIAMSLISCDLLTNEKDEKKDTLYVQFTNDSSSMYTITNIQLMAMGVAGEISEADGEWSANILESGEQIAPGEYKYFTLDIPSSHYSFYRLGVDNGQGNEIMLDLQQNYPGDNYPTITHWGGDDRSVSVVVGYDQYNEYIYISGWSEWVGIEE